MDDDILETVQSIFGKSVRIIDCEKTTSVHEEEILLINGVPVQLNGMTGDDTDAIKAALLTGQMPSVELLNQLLYQAGILQQSVQLETSLSVQSTMVTTEDVSVSRDGHIIDERSIETRENYTYKSNNKEIWQPQLQQNLQNTNKNRQNLESAEDIVTNEGNPTFINLICPEDKGYDHSSIKKGSLSTLHIDTIIDSNGFQTSSNDVVLVSDDHRLHRNLTTASAAMEPKGINPRTSLSLTTTILNKSSCPSESPMTSDTQVMKEPGLEKKSNISNASGHDDGCHSISYSATTAANSLPSNNDIVSKTFERKNASKLSSAQSNVGVQEKSDKNHVDFEFLIDKGQMLPISNNVNSGSGGCGNDSATINKPHSVKSNPIRSSNSTDFASFQHPNKGSRKCYQYIKPQTCLIQQQKEYVPVTSMEDMVQSTSNTKSDDLLVYCDGNLISGSLEALILHMVPTCNYYPDSIYIFSFLLSARLFIRPHELLCSISETWEEQNKYRCDVVDDSKADNFTISLASPGSPTIQRKTKQFPSDSDEYKNEFIQMTQDSAHNCIRLLAEWIETFPYDFRDERLMQQVRILARKCVYIDNALGKQVSKILQMLVQRLTVLEKYEEFLQSLTEAEVNSVDSQQTFYSGVTSVHNPLGRSTTTALATESFAIQKSSTTCSSIHLHPSSLATYCANTNANSSESFSHQNENSQHIHSFTDNSASSVNLNIHNLPGQLLNTSYQSVNDIHGIMDICSSPAQLAHQLTTVELERLSHIGPEEFVQAFAKDYNHTFASQPSSGGASSVLLKASFNDIKKTRNLESYVQWFNRLSYLTATEIVKYSKKKQRVRVIEYWIETARECFNIGNFNSLMAIIAGLNLSPISRLKKTWSKVQSAKFSVLEHQMDPSSNFNSYRSTLKAAMWRSEGATNECERIIIPFFSLFVKDLYFLNEGCSNRLPNNHINFEKCSQLSKQVMEFNEWKKVSCPFEKLPNVIKFLQSSVVLNENTLSIASFECEPPENTHEKGRYKTLKSETKQLAQLY